MAGPATVAESATEVFVFVRMRKDGPRIPSGIVTFCPLVKGTNFVPTAETKAAYLAPLDELVTVSSQPGL